jgi:hypothetical protein
MRHDARVTIIVEKSQPVWCSGCGAAVETAPATWTVQTSPRGTEYLCEHCTRTNVRNIESQLPAEWW